MTAPMTTSRLTLRRFTDADVPVVAATMQVPEVIEKLLWVPFPYRDADARYFVSDIAGEDPGTFAISCQNTLVGCISVGTRLGYWIVPQVWGRGIAFEAAQPVLNAHFAKHSASVLAGYVGKHPRSRRVLEKLGFQDVAVREEYSDALGRNVPFQEMQLTQDRWRAQA